MKKSLVLSLVALAWLSACSNSNHASPVAPSTASAPSPATPGGNLGWARTQTSFDTGCMSGTVTLNNHVYTATIVAQQACVGQTLYLTSYITPVTTTLTFPQYFYQQASVVLKLGQNVLHVDAPDCPAPGSQADLATIPGVSPVLENDIYNSSNLLGYSYGANSCGTNGCTLGYWKNHQPWPGGYVTSTLVSSVFSGPGIPNGYTFQDALTYSGPNKAQLLLKQAVAAVLNIAVGAQINYPLTLSQLVAQVDAALASGADAEIALQTTLDGYNNMGNCPLN